MNTMIEVAEEKKEICLKNIAVATDFSEVSEKAFAYAIAMAGWYGCKIHVVHAIPSETSLLPTLEEHDQLQWQSEERMNDLSRRSELKGIAHCFSVRAGTVWNVVSDLIHKESVDLLVLGTHGWGGVKKMMLGSVAEQMIRLAPCAVLTVGPNTVAPGGGGSEFRRILFATGFGAASEKALPYALFFAKRPGAKLVLLHVLPPTPFPEPGVGPKAYERIQDWRAEETTNVTERLRALLPAKAALECEPEYCVNFDLLFQGILTAAAEHSPDLIVLGAKRAVSSKAVAHIPWTITHEVIAHAKCPVLSVRL